MMKNAMVDHCHQPNPKGYYYVSAFIYWVGKRQQKKLILHVSYING